MRRVWVLCVAVVAGGCVKQLIRPPTEAFVKVGSKQASYRDWSQVDVCLVDQKLWVQDFDAMNALLAELLGQTSAGPEGMWADEHIALLEEAQKQLPMPLKLNAAAITQARSSACRIDGLTRAQELNSQALKRLAEAPELLVHVRARRAVMEWKNAQDGALSTAREKCPAKPKSSAKPQVFYASEDDANHAQWLFCDGHKVVAAPGEPPSFVASETPPARGAKKPTPKEYLDAAAKFESASVSRSPKMPVKVAAKRADEGAEPDGE